MKRWLTLLFAGWILCVLTVPAFADGRGPAFTSYEIVCDKETPYFAENWIEEDNRYTMQQTGTIPAGTTLTVGYEYDFNGVLYGSVEIPADEDTDYAFVRLSDIRLKNESYAPKASEKLSQPHSVNVTAKEGVPLYAGPNEKYTVVTQIPHGTKLTYSYGNDDDIAFRTWGYVTFRNKSGWIYVYASEMGNGVAEIPNDDENPQLWVLEGSIPVYSGTSFGNICDRFDDDETVSDLSDYQQQTEKDRVIGSLEAGHKYTYLYRHAFDYCGIWYCVRIGLRTGWVFREHVNSSIAVNGSERSNTAMTYKPIQLMLRDRPNAQADGQSLSVPANTELIPDYYVTTEDGMFCYTTVLGQAGWYSSVEISDKTAWGIQPDSFGIGYDDVNRSGKRVPIYSDIMQKDTTVGTIPAGAKFTPLYQGDYSIENPETGSSDWTWFRYVRCLDVSGWVEDSDLTAADAEESTAEAEEETMQEEISEAKTDPVSEETEPAEVVAASHSSFSPAQILLCCVGGAVVLTLTAVVTLLLIRRKRTR